jgi:hypothetical protein
MAKRKYFRVGKKKFKKSHIKTITIFLYILVSIYIFPFNDISVEGNEAEVIVELEREGDSPVPQGSNFDGIPYMELSVEQQIRNIAREKGFKWEDYLVRLADCESNLRPDIKVLNKDERKTTDRGLFQINNYWHYEVPDSCTQDIRCSTEWTIERINAGYQHEWMCNKIVLNN